jgi:prepilin-type N-terminal cleavage/methylation domain-containing protein
MKRDGGSDGVKGDTRGGIWPGTGGFTLIEMSIVLVIIGLIVGGVLVGQDLIRAAYVRAQISQIEKFNTAVNTFYGKYQALPGDINASTAAAFGFAARGTAEGQGDGNGIIEGSSTTGGTACVAGYYGACPYDGETGMFWVDLSSSVAGGLIEGGFSTASITSVPETVSGTSIAQYFPEAKIGGGNYVYVYSGGPPFSGGPLGAIYGDLHQNGVNYFGLSANVSWGNTSFNSSPGLTVAQAYRIDSKIDDGLPMAGRVTAWYVSQCGWNCATTLQGDPDAIQPSATTCYDNGNVNGAIYNYSMSFNNGAGLNCALSFRMQGGD